MGRGALSCTQRCRVVTAVDACIYEGSVYCHDVRWPLILQEVSSIIWQALFFILLRVKKTWWRNRFNCRWPDHATGCTGLHGTNSTHKLTWHEYETWIWSPSHTRALFPQQCEINPSYCGKKNFLYPHLIFHSCIRSRDNVYCHKSSHSDRKKLLKFVFCNNRFRKLHFIIFHKTIRQNTLSRACKLLQNCNKKMTSVIHCCVQYVYSLFHIS